MYSVYIYIYYIGIASHFFFALFQDIFVSPGHPQPAEECPEDLEKAAAAKWGHSADGKRWEKMGKDEKKMGKDGKRWEKMGQDGKRWEKMGKDGKR